MILSMSGQAITFLAMGLLGFATGFAYDAVRVLRRVVPHGNIVAQIEDIAFWMLASLLAFYFLLNHNYGEVRGFSVAGYFLGMLLYFIALSPLVMKISAAVIEAVKKAILLMLRIIFAPVRLIIRVLAPIFRPMSLFVRKKAKQGAKKGRRALSTSKRYAKIKRAGLGRQINIIRKLK